MKKLLLLAFVAISIFAQAQTKLTNETHGFIPNERNPMVITNYVEPGNFGKNVIWDFTNLQVTNTFEGLILETYLSKCCNLFSKGNTVLEEFGNFFVFETSANRLEQHGFLSSTGNTQIVYTKPFIKMQYPFTYGSHFDGNFEADYIINGQKTGKLIGTYKVEGDAKGKLKLPNGKELGNVLRVKEVKSSKQIINGTTTNFEDITYRWYVENHRFPVLVLIKSTYNYNGTPSVTTKAAFNSNIISTTPNVDLQDGDLKIEIYPNPYQGRVTIAYNLENTANVNISVFDLTGKLVNVVTSGVESAGQKQHYFSAAELGMSAGAYIVKLRVDNKEVSRKILELK